MNYAVVNPQCQCLVGNIMTAAVYDSTQILDEAESLRGSKSDQNILRCDRETATSKLLLLVTSQ